MLSKFWKIIYAFLKHKSFFFSDGRHIRPSFKRRNRHSRLSSRLPLKSGWCQNQTTSGHCRQNLVSPDFGDQNGRIPVSWRESNPSMPNSSRSGTIPVKTVGFRPLFAEIWPTQILKKLSKFQSLFQILATVAGIRWKWQESCRSVTEFCHQRFLYYFTLIFICCE
jgi:hypothetical protein